MKTRRPPPERVDEPLRWLRANGHDLAPLTGTDTRALLAIAACWRLYFNASDQASVIRAVVELLASLQPQCWRFAKALIPWAGDWSDETEVWSRVEPLLERLQRRAAPGRSYTDVLCSECGAEPGEPCSGIRYDRIHRPRFDASVEAERSTPRDPRQCRGDNVDGSPCRRDAVAGADRCSMHMERSS